MDHHLQSRPYFMCFLLFPSQRTFSTQFKPVCAGTVQHNVWWNKSSGCKSEKIEAKLLLWRGKDKSWRLLLSLCFQVCVLGFGLLPVLLCGCRLGSDFSSPVENTLLWRIWHNFDLSWCSFCWEWRNLSIDCLLLRWTTSAAQITSLLQYTHHSEWVCTACSSLPPFFSCNLQSCLSSPASSWPEELWSSVESSGHERLPPLRGENIHNKYFIHTGLHLWTSEHGLSNQIPNGFSIQVRVYSA